MHFNLLALLFSFVLPVVVLSAPIVSGPQDAPVQLYARAVGVVVEPSPTGDFKLLLHRPAEPEALLPGCSKQETKVWKKLNNKCKTWNNLHAEFTSLVTARVTAAIHAAEPVLHAGAGPVHALVQSAYHHHADHDDLQHWTFSFTAPGCGAGPCVGHAYGAGESRHARIFSADHRTIFNA